LVAAGDELTVDMAIEQWRGRLTAFVSAKGGHFKHSLELTDGVDIVNYLSLLCNCVMICLNI